MTGSLPDFLGSSQDRANGGQQLLAPQGKENVYRWATVVEVGPLRIRFDGDSSPLAISPDSLVGVIKVGDRVWCQMFARRVIILGRGPSIDRDYEGVYGTMLAGSQTIGTTSWTRISGFAVVPGQNMLNDLETDVYGFLVHTPGLYQVSVSAQFAANATNRRYVGVTWGSVLDGTPPPFGYQEGIPAAASPVIPSWSGDIALAVGARVMAWVYQDSGASLNVPQTMLKIRRVGPAPTS